MSRAFGMVRSFALAALANLEGGIRRIRVKLADAKDRGAFIAGDRAEWADFQRRRWKFLERFPSLLAAAKKALIHEQKTPTDADIAIFFLERSAAEDFMEILLLCANGYGIGATKLLRGMHERVVIARYLRMHPDEAENFNAWGVVDQGKRARAVLDAFGASLKPDMIAKLKADIEAGKGEAARFMVDDCKVCGTKKQNGPSSISCRWRDRLMN